MSGFESSKYYNLSDAVCEVIQEVFAYQATSFNLVTPELASSYEVRDFENELLLRCSISISIAYRTVTTLKLLPLKGLRRRTSIFIIHDFEGFLEVYDKLTSKLFRYSGFYIIVLTNGEIPENREIFELLWKRQIFKANIIYQSQRNQILVKTFFPFNEGSCNDPSPIELNRYTDGKYSRDLDDFYPVKFNNLYGCEIRVAISSDTDPYIVIEKTIDGKYHFAGRDIKLITILAESLNFTINYTYMNQIGYFYENGSSAGSLRSLLHNESDLSISDWWLQESRLKFFDATVPYNSDKIVFIVAPARKFTNFEKLIYPFDDVVWMLILLIFLVGGLTIFLVRRQAKAVQIFVFGQSVNNHYMNLLSGFIGGYQKTLPKRNFARFLLMVFLMYAMVMRSVYQGSFYKLMQSGKRHKEVQSIEQMIKDDYTFYIFPGLTEVIQGVDGLKNRFIPVLYRDRDFLAEIIRHDPFVKKTFCESLALSVYYNQNSPKEKRNKLCKEVFLTIPIIIYVKKDFFLLGAMNKNIDFLSSAGLIDFWHAQDVRMEILREKESATPKVITITQLLGVFHLLYLSFLLSFLVFACEVGIYLVKLHIKK